MKNEIKFIAIGGVPCSGKSTITKRFIQQLTDQDKSPKPFQFKCIRGTMFPKRNIIILGVYDSEAKSPFCGTDRLSFLAKNHLMALLEDAKNILPERCIIMFEGDRLFNLKTLQDLQLLGHQVTAFVITAPETVLNDRRAERQLQGFPQTDAFIKRQKTKIDNIIQQSGNSEPKIKLNIVRNENEIDYHTILAKIENAMIWDDDQ